MRALVLLLSLLFLCTPALAEEHGGGEAPAVEGFFADLDPIILPIVDGGQVTQSVSFAITIETSSQVDADHARALKPRLSDGFIVVLYGILNDAGAPKKGLVDVTAVKEQLLPVAQDILGKDRVKAVLLQAVQQRGV